MEPRSARIARRIAIFFLNWSLIFGVLTILALRAEAEEQTVEYSMLVVIPLIVVMPDDTAEFMNQEAYDEAYRAVEALDTHVYEWTNGRADIEVDVIEYEGRLPYTMCEVCGDIFPDTAMIRLLFEAEDYDFVAVITDPEAAPVTELDVVGLTPIDDSGTFWVSADWEAPETALHELAHVLELRFGGMGYTNWPECRENTKLGAGIHCGVAYGYGHDSSIEWLEAYYSGTARGGTGFGPDVWNYDR